MNNHIDTVPVPHSDDIGELLGALAALAWYYRRDDTVTLARADLTAVTGAPTGDQTFRDLCAGLREAPSATLDQCLFHLSGNDIGYDTRQWDPAVAHNALSRLPQLLADLRANPDRPLREVDLRTDADRRLWAEVNDTYRPRTPGVRLERLFEPNLAARPDAPAIVDDRGALSYRDFDRRVDQFAQVLWNRGVRRGDLVGLMMPRGRDTVAAVYGILRTGAAYVPLDPGNPVSRNEFILSDSGVGVLLADPDLLVGLEPPCPVLDPAEVTADVTPRDRDRWTGGDEDVAYIIYTSGSTGRPKGVVVEHRSVVNRLDWGRGEFPIGPGDVTMLKTPLTFDVSVPELFFWGARGATLSVLAPGGERDPGTIAATVARDGVTTLNFVPSMLEVFLDHVDRTRAEDLGSVRLVCASGEAITADLVRRFRQLVPDCRLVNLYGPTEASVEVTHFDCAPNPRRGVPIGRPIDNVRVYVLDEDYEIRPTGAVGELFVAGDALARGYLNRPELTAERFPADLVADETRVYRTGDLARLLPSGDFEYLGRLDDQIKIRGIRVEPGEIDQALRDHPAVEEAAVIPYGAEGRTDNLCGYLVTNAPLRPRELRDHLAARLPAHMIPACFATVASFPLSPSGKLDRRALPPVDVARFVDTEFVVDARGGPDASVADEGGTDPVTAAWSRVLGIPARRLRPEDNFYDLGGTSLLALRVVDALKGMVTVRDLYTSADLGDLRTLVASR